MNPALSVVFFTVLSGAGLALLIVTAAALLSGQPQPLRLLLGVAIGLTVAGLVSSVFHLGQPLRAWRAFSQWRTSWLSREGVAAVATLASAAAWWWAPHLTALGVVTGLLALVTLRCTAGIYTSLKPVPEWHNPWVLPIFLAISGAGGAALWLAVGEPESTAAWWAGAGAVAVAWLAKSAYWLWIKRLALPVTAGSALGLGADARVERLFDPHTEANYLIREMGYSLVRERRTLVRAASLIAALLAVVILVGGALQTVAGNGWVWLAAALVLVATTLERWLFFAEARHVVQLYYRP